MDPPLTYMQQPEQTAGNLPAAAAKGAVQATTGTSGGAGGSSTHYLLTHKEFIVRLLNAPPLFDNKLHKNEQLWDDIVMEFYEKFPDQSHRTKASIKDQFNVQQKSFRDVPQKSF